MHPKTLKLLIPTTIILLSILLTSPTPSTALKRRPHPSKLPSSPHKLNHPPKRPNPKKKSRLARLFGRRRRPKKLSPPREMLNSEESKNGVYFYSLPRRRTTHRPRIILGNELNFNSLGISKNQQTTKQTDYTTDQDYTEEQPFQLPLQQLPKKQQPQNSHRSPKRQKQSPGYRLKQNTPWQQHYILEHQAQSPQKPNGQNPPKVMDSMLRAASELRNAYKTAIIQSAKVAKFTGHAMGKYFIGVRNIFGGNDDYNRKISGSPTSLEGVSLQVPTTVAKQTKDDTNDDTIEESPSLPVHLDWGGSVWKLFYNKSNSGKGGGKRKGSLSDIEENGGSIVVV